MPILPDDPVQMMALLGDLNAWLTRVNRAYNFSDVTDSEKSVIESEVRAMLSDDFPADSHYVSWRGGAATMGWNIIGFPCENLATTRLDDVIGDIEGRFGNP